MFERFTKQARAAVSGAAGIARERGATHVEAEHLLLAVTQGNSAGAQALKVCGLDFDALDAALVAENERSLAAVGVTAGTPAFSPFVESPRLATSAKAALGQALRESIARSTSAASNCSVNRRRATTAARPSAGSSGEVRSIMVSNRS